MSFFAAHPIVPVVVIDDAAAAPELAEARVVPSGGATHAPDAS